MYFAIRDDDTSYFTKPEDLRNAYDFLDEDEPISLSIVPYTVTNHKQEVFPYGKIDKNGYYAISDNHQLCDYLRNGYSNKKIDILMHGITHEYKKPGNEWISEMDSVTHSDSSRFSDALNFLNETFKCKINVFVAPNNDIGKIGIKFLEENNLDYSGIIKIKKDRKFNFHYLNNYFYRWIYRYKKGIQCSKTFNYGKHKEIAAFTLSNFEKLKQSYNECKKNNWPFIVYTHYWDVNSNEETKNLLKEIYNYCKDDGAVLTSVSSIFKHN
jgi:hypothetical protein